MRFVALGLASVLMISPGAAIAQEKTTEGAQKFLALTLYRTTISFFYADGGVQDGTVSGEVTSPSKCMTKFAALDLRPNGGLGANLIQDKYLSWERIAGVSQENLGVTVRRLGSNEYYRFWLQTEDLAKRVATAMEFLRENCDEAAATGF